MKVLVTGAAGHIGSKMTKSLLDQGHEIVVLDNLSFGSRENLKGLENQITYVQGDMRKFEDVMKAMEGVDIVNHQGGPSSMLMYVDDPVDRTYSTVIGFLNIMEAMRKMDVKKIVYASSGGVYEGNPCPHHENLPLTPPDMKALAKKFVEDMAKLYTTQYGIKTVGIRPFMVYGDNEKSKGDYASTISLFVWMMLREEDPTVWADGNQMRDFIHVDDVVRAYTLAMEKNFPYAEVFNAGTGVESSMNKVIQIINEYLGTNYKSIYVPPKLPVYTRRSLADPTKAEKLLGFKYKIGIREGIARVIKANGGPAEPVSQDFFSRN
ncbi:MAG: SDR family NAD(P)-dependent oxidoreductase [Candidatus Aenigmarchaeota archaeon]|nr:SDR family NAD(P)-dependent oxidoreductase [Candidatus Aenigmarchaeota archaeon]